MSLLISFLFSMAAAAATPSNCSTIDFEDQLGPVRDQGEHGFCFGYVAADMIGQRLGWGPKKQISAAQVSMSYHFENYLDPKSYQSPEKQSQFFAALGTIYNFPWGVEEMSTLRSEAINDPKNNPNFKNLSGGNLNDAILNFNVVPKICDEKRLPSNNLGETLQKFERKAYRKMTALSCTNPETPIDQRNLQSIVPSDSLLKVIYEEATSRCPKNPDSRPYLIPKTFNEGAASAMKGIDEGLKKGRIVGISYHVNSMLKNADPQDTDDLHASTIIGRSFNKLTKQCEYKLRNSWGYKCSSYRNSSNVRCDHGGAIWVSELLLDTMITNSTYIE